MTTPYTSLRVTDAGVVLFEAHLARLAGADPTMREPFERWAETAPPGVYVVRGSGGQLSVEARAGSRLVEGIPIRFLPSPFAAQRGPFIKPAPPSPYDSVRTQGLATLLTDAGGAEVYESCAASVLAWDGATVVAVPDHAPRVASVAEACVLAAVPHRRARLAVGATWPLLLVNAVAGVIEPSAPGRDRFPPALRARLAQAIAATASRVSATARRAAAPG